jgi:diguanylate cyclase (GGDEF)-like protein/PAS domain S-box-containing protein
MFLRACRSPWAVILVGILATALLFLHARELALHDFLLRFESNSAARANRTMGQMQGILSTTQALGQFVEGTDNMDRRGFAGLATPLLKARSDVKTFCWVPAGKRERADGSRLIRYPLLYIEPEGSGIIPGFDLASAPGLGPSLERARDTGKAYAATWSKEILIILPTYKKDLPATTAKERKAAFRGFILGLPRLDRVLPDFREATVPEGFSVELLDLSAGCTLSRWTAPPSGIKGSWTSALLPACPSYLSRMTFAGLNLGIRFSTGRAYMSKYYSLSYWLFLPVGFALTFLAALYRKSVLLQQKERKQAEAALKESENIFRDLADKSVLGISLVQDGVYRYVNSRFAEIHGLSAGEMVNHPATSQMILLEDSPRVAEHFQKCFTDGSNELEFRIVAKNGEVRTVLGYVAGTTYGGRPATIGTLLETTGLKRAEEHVRQNELRLLNAMDLAKMVCWEFDAAAGELVFNDAFYAFYATTVEQEGGYRMSIPEYAARFVHPDDRERYFQLVENDSAPTDGELLCDIEHRIVRRNGQVRTIIARVRGTVGGSGPPKLYGVNQDITGQKEIEEALRWKTAFLEALLDASSDGILVIDGQGKSILQNQRTVDLWKIPKEIADRRDDEAQARHVLSVVKDPDKFNHLVLYLYSHPNESIRDEVELLDGTVLDRYSSPVVGKDGTYYGRIFGFHEITELKRYWAMLENLSTTDGLTELPNRRRFDEFLNREWRRAMRDRSLLSLLLLDIDFFKEFNDHYGHLAGDDCLRQVAQVLKEVVQRPGDLFARYGGDEFACILSETDSKGAVALAERIRERVKAVNIPHFSSSAANYVTLSCGVATMIPESRQAPSDLLRLADGLLYSAKENGRDQVRSWRRRAKGRRAVPG